jgi:spore maturation protein CgeB
MRILFVAPLYDYGVPERGFGFEYYNFYEPLLDMGHDVSYFDVFSAPAGDRVSSALLDKVNRDRPDLLFACLFRDELRRDVIRQISDGGSTMTYNWFCDDHWRFDSFTRLWAPSFNFVSTTARSALPRYKEAGITNVLSTQWAAATARYRPHDLPLRYDVTFVGQKYGDRGEVLESIRRAGVDVTTWGTGWGVRDFERWALTRRGIGRLGGRRILRHREGLTRCTQEQMVAIFEQSRMSLNLTEPSQGDERQIKGRTFEIPACRGVLLTGPAEGLEEYFEAGREIVVYDDASTIPELCRSLLAYSAELERIREAGYRRTVAEHTYRHRFNALFQQMGLSG